MQHVFNAPAKINLMLHVVGRLPDGYHHLQSLVAFTTTGDEIVISESDVFRLTLTGTFAGQMPDQQNNIVFKAYWWINNLFSLRGKIHIHLTKNLPVASGIGGGSSDAAATIAALVRWHNIPLSPPDVDNLILGSGILGADVPLCLAHQFGRGPLLWIDSSGRETLPLPVRGKLPLHVVLANPGVAVLTSDIFKNIFPPYTLPQPPIFDENLLDYLKEQRNDLMAPAMEQVKEIRAIIGGMDNQDGCLLARMSGSGATCFGLFDDKILAQAALKAVQDIIPDRWVQLAIVNTNSK